MQGYNKFNKDEYVIYGGQEVKILAIRYVGLLEGFMYHIFNGKNGNLCWVKEAELKQK